MIDNTCGFERMSFMDGFSGYNQIKMYPNDEKHTSFRIPLGVGVLLYCHALRIKKRGSNISESYEYKFSRAYKQNSGMLRRRYYSEKPAKSDHIADLKTVFDIMQAHQLKMNPTKSFLRVASGKFLGFVVTSKGIHLDPEKVHAI